MFTIALVLAFAFGAIIGSFLNVVICRYHTGMNFSILSGRSKCMVCNTTLTYTELIPIVSFFIQGGKCRTCKAAISWQYPLIEFVTGVLFALVFYVYSLPILASPAPLFLVVFVTLYYWILVSLFVVIGAYDIYHKIIPNTFVYALGAVSLLYLLFLYMMHVIGLEHLISNVFAGFLLAAPFAAFWFFSGGRLMGLGDAKLTLVIGWVLGFAHGAAAVILAVWVGAIWGILLLLFPQQNKLFTMKSEIPFGPFLILGALTITFTGWNIFSILSLFT